VLYALLVRAVAGDRVVEGGGGVGGIVVGEDTDVNTQIWGLFGFNVFTFSFCNHTLIVRDLVFIIIVSILFLFIFCFCEHLCYAECACVLCMLCACWLWWWWWCCVFVGLFVCFFVVLF